MRAAKRNLWIVGALFLGLGSYTLVWPFWLESAFGVAAVNASGLSDIRSVYGGFYVGTGVYLIWCSLNTKRIIAGLMFQALSMTGFYVGRITSLVMDGIPSVLVWVFFTGEVFAFLLACYHLRACRA